jgi:transcription elongation factor Elf1
MEPQISQEEMVRRIETVRAGLPPSRSCPNCGHQTLVSERRDRRAS